MFQAELARDRALKAMREAQQRRVDARAQCAAAVPSPYQWRAALGSEHSTLTTLAVLICLMLAKENLEHIPKYWRKHGFSANIGTWLPSQHTR